MKKLVLLFYFIPFITYSQIPAGYYDTATGSGYTLKTQLYNIILGHTDNGYTPGLWDTYQTSDRDIYYENDNTILDMYSENSAGLDPYTYTYSTDQCGTYANEGDCYNREHIVPQSVFNSLSPMRNDAHFVTPTDGKVNGLRSAYPHGVVGTATTTTLNGSKLGSALNSSYSAGYSGTVFEPIDEFKGDIARMYFYFATRYENVITSWGVSFEMFDGTSDKVFSEPFLTILMTWHTNDPVSTRELDRNDAIYARQNNRNPFIDHPEYVNQIWSTTPDTQAPTAPTNLIASNITNTTADLNWTASTDDVAVTSYEIFKDGVFLVSSATNSFNLTGLTQNTTYNFTVFAKDAAGNTSTVSNTETFTTTNINDVDAPTVPTNLVVSNETSSTLDVAWTASTDNIGVTGYDIYVDGVFNATTAATTYIITGLSPTTTYSLTVLAKDGAANSSAQSTPVNGTTTAVSSTCASETFTNIGASSSSYATRTWTGDNGGTWNATDARTDQTLTGSAITIQNGALTAPTTANGIGDLTVTTKLIFSGTIGTFDLKVNGTIVGSIPNGVENEIITTTITGINISGNVSVVIDNSSNTSNRVIFDDLSWTCFAGIADTEAPSAIVDLSANNTTSTTTDLTWSASTDNVGVTSYEVFKDGVFLASTATNAYNVTGLAASTSYNFTVYAKDAAGNTSLVSNTVAVTTAAAGATELFISEYVEGSGTNKAIEIANFTGSSIDLSIYSLKRNTNGGATWGVSLALSGTLINGDIFVASNSSDPTILAATDLSSTADALLFNGNDPVGLFKNNILIDIVGNFNGGTADFAKDVTKRRIGTITSPNTTYTLSEWIDFAIDTYNDIGTHNVTLSTYKFTPNLFSVYPNPATTNKITISVKETTIINSIQLYNLIGQLVIDIQQPKVTQNKVEVHNIPAGMYIVKIANEKAYSTKRLIVQ